MPFGCIRPDKVGAAGTASGWDRIAPPVGVEFRIAAVPTGDGLRQHPIFYAQPGGDFSVLRDLVPFLFQGVTIDRKEIDIPVRRSVYYSGIRRISKLLSVLW